MWRGVRASVDCVSQLIAKHVMNIHMNRPTQNGDENGEVVGEIDIDKMKRFIAFCKAYVLPEPRPRLYD